MQKIWVCGARGQIGQAVNDVVDKLEFEMLDTDAVSYTHLTLPTTPYV